MYQLQNSAVSVSLDDNLKTLEFRKGGIVFRSRAPFSLNWSGIPISAASIRGKKITADSSGIRIDFSDFCFPARFPGHYYERPARKFVPDFRFSAMISLDDGDLVIRLSSFENLGRNQLTITVAGDFFQASAREKARLILPISYGIRIDFPRTDTYSGRFVEHGSWSLPVHALFRQNGGIGLWCDNPDRDYIIAFNNGISENLSACCRQLYGPLATGPREMRFMIFPPEDDFRALARRCRDLRKKSGRFRTLQEKIRENPEVGQLPGTVFWKHNVYYRKRPAGIEKSYSLYTTRPDWIENEGLPGNWTAEEIFATARQKGFDRVNVCSTGWSKDGYDACYPTRFPINPERGTEQEFINAARNAKKMSEGYSLSVHDNYIDAYDTDEGNEREYLQEEAGAPSRRFVCCGGQAYFMCPRNSLKYAARDLPRVAALTGRGCIYLDVAATMILPPCQAKEHPLSRQQGIDEIRKLFALGKKIFGAVASEGCGTDRYADLLDIGAYGTLHFSLAGKTEPHPVPVPLWQMVYHDSILNYNGEGHGGIHGSEYLLYQALFVLLPTSFNHRQKQISHDLRSAFTAPMTDFEDLIPRTVFRDEFGAYQTRGVSRSSFGDGTQVIANFNTEPYLFNGKPIPARDFIIIRS